MTGERQTMDKIEAEIKKKLRDFTLDVHVKWQGDSLENGKCMGILGASGCGKSMMLKSIAGIVVPDQGRICLNGRVLYDSEKKINLSVQKRHVGYLFQDYALFPNMTVEENIAVGLKTGCFRKRKRMGKREREERVREGMRQFRLEELRGQYPNHLSGGQKQRVALARILCYEPELILLDEPFSAMDAHLKERLRLELLSVLKRYRGKAILVTHDRDEAYQLCDRLILMEQGKIIKGGKTKDVFQNPGTVGAASLTGCKNISRIIRINPHKIRAMDWGVELETEKEVDVGVTHVGIRAHDMIPVDPGRNKGMDRTNVIPVGQASVCEMPFEWYITLENGIWWKIAKRADGYASVLSLPQALHVPKDAILLLKENKGE